MQIKLLNVRAAFTNVFEAKAMNPGDDPAFSCTFLFPKDHPAAAEVRAAIEAVALEKWEKRTPEIMKAIRAKGDLCLHDGAEKANYDGFDGNLYVSSRNKTRPKVLDQKKNPLVLADGKPYSGCYVNGVVDIWAQDNNYGKRVNATLQGVQFVKDGDSFTGGRAAADADFDVVEDADDLLG